MGIRRFGALRLVELLVAAALLPGVALGVALPGVAWAGGFEVPDNGSRAVARGAAFTVRADDLTAIAHNPAGLLREGGTRVMWSHNLVHAPMRFVRQRTTLPHRPLDGTRDPLSSVENETPFFPLGGMLVAATDFGLPDWTFTAGIYGPSASGHQEWPISGGQRYMLTKLDVLLVYYTLGAAWGKRDEYGLGVTLQYAHQPKTELSLVVDANTSGAALEPYYSPTDVEATIQLSDPFAFTANVGAFWRVRPWLELAVAGRVLPVYLDSAGDISLKNVPGGSQFTAAQLAVEGSAARLSLVLPPTARAGIRYRYLEGEFERFDLELDVVYEAWSMLKEYQVELDGTIKLFAKHEAPDVEIQKRWRDTVSVRLGGTWNFDAATGMSAGTFYETGAVPENYTHLDFPSFDRVGVSTGLQRRVGPVDVSVSYSHVFQEDRDVDERFGKVFQERPIAPCSEVGECEAADGTKYSGVPANAGTFESSFDIVSVGVQYRF